MQVVFASLAVFADAPLNVAQPAQCIDFDVPVIELSGEGQRLGVVLAGEIVLADEVLYEA